ncbi:MAG: hypothetical protein J7501_15805 [Bdellovibrio sp.]|nr:hypothetical protein [Bdellovibrio sp.]
MKVLLSTLVVALSLVGSLASATEGVMLRNIKNEVRFVPLQRHCDDEVAQPESLNSAEQLGYCISKSGRCREGYSRRVKVCWGGWHKGFYRCGTVCSPDERSCEPYDGSEYCRWKTGRH